MFVGYGGGVGGSLSMISSLVFIVREDKNEGEGRQRIVFSKREKDRVEKNVKSLY